MRQIGSRQGMDTGAAGSAAHLPIPSVTSLPLHALCPTCACSNGIAMQWSVCDSDAWVAAASYLAQQQLAAQGDSLANYPFK